MQSATSFQTGEESSCATPAISCKQRISQTVCDNVFPSDKLPCENKSCSALTNCLVQRMSSFDENLFECFCMSKQKTAPQHPPEFTALAMISSTRLRLPRARFVTREESSSTDVFDERSSFAITNSSPYSSNNNLCGNLTLNLSALSLPIERSVPISATCLSINSMRSLTSSVDNTFNLIWM